MSSDTPLKRVVRFFAMLMTVLGIVVSSIGSNANVVFAAPVSIVVQAPPKAAPAKVEWHAWAHVKVTCEGWEGIIDDLYSQQTAKVVWTNQTGSWTKQLKSVHVSLRVTWSDSPKESDGGDWDVSQDAACVPTATSTATATATNTPTALPTKTNTPLPTNTATLAPTVTPSPTPLSSSTTVVTTPTETPQLSTATPLPTTTQTQTPAPTDTPEPGPTLTETPNPTATKTPVPTATQTAAPSATATSTGEPIKQHPGADLRCHTSCVKNAKVGDVVDIVVMVDYKDKPSWLGTPQQDEVGQVSNSDLVVFTNKSKGVEFLNGHDDKNGNRRYGIPVMNGQFVKVPVVIQVRITNSDWLVSGDIDLRADIGDDPDTGPFSVGPCPESVASATPGKVATRVPAIKAAAVVVTPMPVKSKGGAHESNALLVVGLLLAIGALFSLLFGVKSLSNRVRLATVASRRQR